MLKDLAIKLVGDWEKAKFLHTAKKKEVNRVFNKIAKSEAKHFKKMVKRCFVTQGSSNGKKWKKNARTTQDTKKARKTLKNTGMLKKSIKLVGKKGEYFVGVPYTAHAQDGSRMVDIASRMEYGEIRSVKVTEAMYLAVMDKLKLYSRKSRTGRGDFVPGNTITIVVPERSFLRATYQAHMKQTDYNRRLLTYLKEYRLK